MGPAMMIRPVRVFRSWGVTCLKLVVTSSLVFWEALPEHDYYVGK